ncbi:adenosine deaminase [Candidatus Peregrinibacteria bacterium]|nr:adenosine deaminase [Candidatus Peregrinibacteria bacterium]
MTLDREFFEEMPKAELHLHLDGALKPKDIWALAQKHRVTLPNLPEQTQDALQRYYQLPKGVNLSDPEAFNRFLGMFKVALSVMQTRTSLRDAALAHVMDLHSRNYVYAETRFAPQYHTEGGMSLEMAIQSVIEGLQLGYERTRKETLVKPIVCIGREANQETSLAVAKAALAFEQDGVVALDLACNETLYPPELHKPAFELTFKSPLARTVHAGEFAKTPEQRVQNVRTALNDLKADGLGHAIPLPGQADLLAHVKRAAIRVESCPLSNKITRAINGDLRELALDVLLKEGVLVTVNTDDPAIFGTSLADVLQAVCRAYGFGKEEVRKLMRNAVESAFCDHDEEMRAYFAFKHKGLHLLSDEPDNPFNQLG